MVYASAAVLLVLWFFGLVTSYTIGGLIHVLLAAAVLILLLRMVGRRRQV